MKEEIVYVDTKQVKCFGENEIAGHPQIYMDMGEDTQTVCPYCSRTFKFKE